MRKLKVSVPQFVCLIVLLAVGCCFFITLFTVVFKYGETAEQYFDDNSYADVTFYGNFNNEDVETLSGLQGVELAQGRTVKDFREGERVFRAVSLTGGVNKLHIYEGRLPRSNDECVLLRRNAEAMGLSVGDTVTLGNAELTITGLAASPEYIYMVRNERTMMAQPGAFAVLYVTEDFFPQGYNEIAALTVEEFSPGKASEAVGAFRFALREDQVNHYLYLNDLEEIGSFAYIFPFIFAVLIAVVIYVMLRRTVQKDRRQIGTMKALGMKDGSIIGIYLRQFCAAAFAGALLGCLSAIPVSDAIIGIFSSMFEVPALKFAFYPALWIGAAAVSVALCAVSGYTALFGILSLLPAQAMRPQIPKGGKRILIERVGFIWNRFSWGTRYSVKNSLRNKGRFFAVLLGMCGSCALLVFSLGFNDSIGNTQNEYFNGFANYDVIVSFDPLPIDASHPVLSRADSGYKALVMPVEIKGESHNMVIAEKGFDMVNIPLDKMQTGIILPEYFAAQWGFSVGDEIEIGSVGLGADTGYTVEVSAITPQYLGPTVYTSFDCLRSVTDGLPPVYNTVYARSGDMAGLAAFLSGNGIEFSTTGDDRTSFDSIMESMSVLIWFMIGCSVVLGFTVLYSVGLINLSSREYEYMFMGVMGFPHGGIMTAHIKESLLQLIPAVPLGFLAGNILLESIKGEFSNNSFVISTAVLPQSYVIAASAVIAVTAVMAAVTSRHINRLDIVEGLKAQDE